MRVCLIAPASSDLDIPGEVQDVANTFSEAGHVVRITRAERRDLRDAMRSGEFGLVWFAGHSGPEGFELADGAIWHPIEVGRWLVAVSAWSFVANACFSAEHVMAIQAIADVDVVATIAPDGVTDDVAAETALFLAQAYVDSDDLVKATRIASAGGKLQYRFFPGNGAGMTSTTTRADEQAHEDVAALVQLFKGDPRTGQPGLVATLNTMAQRMDIMSKSFDAYRQSTEARLDALERGQRQGGQVIMSPRVASLLLGMSILLVVLMFWVLVRLGGA